MAGTEKRIRLNKYIALSGIYSRRQADKLIFNGFVKVNETFIQDPSVNVDPEADTILVNDKKISIDKKIFIKFYKPVNVLSSYKSQGGKKNLSDFKPFNKLRLPYAGRLDYNSEGLMFFCNDGDLTQRLLLPKNHIEKEYKVYVDKELAKRELLVLQKGVSINNKYYKRCSIDHVGDLCYRVILHEGKKRQIREMFKYFNINVLRLIRTRIASIYLDDLKPGEYKYLTENELGGITGV
jgi:pseudouridine synthase